MTTHALPVTHHRTTKIDGVSIFYREAGPVGCAGVLLLHRIPNLIAHVPQPHPGLWRILSRHRTRLSGLRPERYAGLHQVRLHVRSLCRLVDGLLNQLEVKRYAMYVMDYGAPVGWRLALKHPERVTGLIVQNGNAYEEGMKEFWDPIKAYWGDRVGGPPQSTEVLVVPETTKFQYTDGVTDLSRISPDNWVHDQALLIAQATSTSRWIFLRLSDQRCRSIPQFRHSSASASRRR